MMEVGEIVYESATAYQGFYFTIMGGRVYMWSSIC